MWFGQQLLKLQVGGISNYARVGDSFTVMDDLTVKLLNEADLGYYNDCVSPKPEFVYRTGSWAAGYRVGKYCIAWGRGYSCGSIEKLGSTLYGTPVRKTTVATIEFMSTVKLDFLEGNHSTFKVNFDRRNVKFTNKVRNWLYLNV